MKALVLFYLHTLAAAASLASLVAMLVMDRWHATIALICIILFLVALLAITYAALTRHLRTRYPDGYTRISTFARYSSDGKVVRYEAYKHIQCRQPVMSSFIHGFRWTGSCAPRITSTLQVVRTRTDGGASDYDCVELAFPLPLLYGDAAVVHHAMEMDDFDGASAPHVEFRVQEPVQLIVWRVELRHLPRQYRKGGAGDPPAHRCTLQRPAGARGAGAVRPGAARIRVPRHAPGARLLLLPGVGPLTRIAPVTPPPERP